ncbi:MAG: FtsW/RodA/SpoVE family cell cycle protein [Simkaniaceae bacterium]|nr:FtsW/RodA/SpoVE family cell cycle protein [Simkaniaceae bacterium]
MWNHQYLKRIDFRTLPIIFGLMIMSLLIISLTTNDAQAKTHLHFFTPYVKTQLEWFAIGWVAYLFFAGFDYRKLRELTWILYLLMIVMLIGLFFAAPIQNVHRWYRLPFNFTVQPSEFAKLIIVLTLSWFLEYKNREREKFTAALQAGFIVGIPFLLILKQPDLGSALILFPITLVMFYFGGINKKMIVLMSLGLLCGVLFILLLFLGILSHEEMKPFFTFFLKDYQYERFNPATYHQIAAQTAIALGRFTGSGLYKSAFTGQHFLPAAHTDSVFPAFAEEFGILGAFLMLLFFFGLIYFSFQVTAISKDPFGRLLSAGITAYLAIHVIINIGMMCGFLPITGVPLILVTAGGSSVLATMIALGILQSIYARRFTF